MTQTFAMQQADLLQMSDTDFQKLISELEQDPIFNLLYRKQKMIHYRRFANTDINPIYMHIDDHPISGSFSPDIETFIIKHSDILKIIREIGEENFRKYFLFPEDNYPPEYIVTACDIDIPEIDAIIKLVDGLSVLSTFYHPPDSGNQMISYTCLASIEPNGNNFTVSYLSPAYARGHYIIEYEKIEELITDGNLDRGEISRVKKLLSKLELINNRKNILQKILTVLIDRQSLYLTNRQLKALLPFNQKELAREIGATPSSVSRALNGKSIITPWGEEIPLKNLLPNPHLFKKELVKRIIENDTGLKSDKDIGNRIRDAFGVQISRRSISALRKELHITKKMSAEEARGRNDHNL